MSRDDPYRYSDEDVAIILRKATELAGRSDVATDVAADLSLDEIKVIGAEVGIEPVLIEQAAGLVPRRPPTSLLERLIGGPVRHRVDAQFPVALTEQDATHLLSAVRAETDRQGTGQADSAGMSWHSEPGSNRLSITAHSGDDRTTVRVVVDRATLGLQLVGLAGAAIVVWSLGVVEDIESLGDLLLWLTGSAGALTIARTIWAFSTRAIEERSSALLDVVSRALPITRGESDEE